MKNKREFFKLLLAGIFLIPLQAFGQSHYYLLTYGDSSTTQSNPVLLEKIDLDNGIIAGVDTLANKGYLPENKPLHFTNNNHKILLSFIESGIDGKNSILDTNKVYYYLHSVDTFLNRIRSDSFVNVQFDLRFFPGRQSFGFGIKQNAGNNYIMPFGEYVVEGNGNFRRLGSYNTNLIPGQLRNLNKMKYPLPLDTMNAPLIYYCKKDYRTWLIKLNIRHDLIIDSLRLQTDALESVVFAYHPTRGKIYSFHLNYEYHSENPDRYKGYGQNWISPEVLIYNPSTFQLMERHTINDFSSGNYPNFESGLADVIGDYIVYYFFEEDHVYNFSPAMLFIFDTRTNEARWLRVGWR